MIDLACICPARLSVPLVAAIYSRLSCIIIVLGWMSERVAVEFFPLQLISADVFLVSKMTEQHSTIVET